MLRIPFSLRSLLAVLTFAGLILASSSSILASDPEVRAIELKPWAAPALTGSTDGGFSALIDGRWLLGLRDADTTGGLALSSRSVREAANDPGDWRRHPLSTPLWAATALHGEAIILVGGLLDDQPERAVTRITLQNGELRSDPLPALPSPRIAAGAAVLNRTLYVFGGSASLAPLAPVADMLALDLDLPTAGWRKVGDYPGRNLIGAAVVVQDGYILAFGGAQADGKPTTEAWGFRVKPRDGTLVAGWRVLSPLPDPMVHARAVAYGRAHVALLGARSATTAADLFGASEVPGSTPLHLYHTVLDAWAPTDHPVELHTPLVVARPSSLLLAGAPPGQSGTRTAELVFPRVARSLAWPDYTVLLGYFALMLGIGVYFSRKQENSEEFALGGRNVKWWAAGISMFATGASAISMMAIPAQAFATNLVFLLPVAVFIPAFFLQAYVLFPLLRRLKLTSTFAYLARRFGVPLRLIASFQCIAFQTIGRMSVVLVLPSLAISATTGIHVYTSVLIMGLLTTIYTALGGFEAVIWTDVAQAVLMIVMPLVVIGIAIFSVPMGWSGFVETSLAYGKFDFAVLSWDAALPTVWVLVIGSIFSTFAIVGDQPVIQRVFSAPLEAVRRTSATYAVCGILIAMLVNGMGLAIFYYLHHTPTVMEPGMANDQILPLFVAQKLPVGVAGLMIAAIFAAAMSTLSSTMNSVATLVLDDFVVRVRPQLSERNRLRVLRGTSYAVGLIGTGIALLMASMNITSMFATWNELGALLGGGVVGIYMLGMFTRRANSLGAIVGALGSVGAVLFVKFQTHLHWAAYTPVAIISCLILGYLASLLLPQRRDLTGLTVFTPTAN